MTGLNGTIRNRTLQVMVLVNAEVWNDTTSEEYIRCETLMLDMYMRAANDANKAKVMSDDTWNDVTVSGVPFKFFCDSDVNIQGDRGSVLIPQFIAKAQQEIIRPDTKFAVGFEPAEFQALWGVDAPPEPPEDE